MANKKTPPMSLESRVKALLIKHQNKSDAVGKLQDKLELLESNMLDANVNTDEIVISFGTDMNIEVQYSNSDEYNSSFRDLKNALLKVLKEEHRATLTELEILLENE